MTRFIAVVDLIVVALLGIPCLGTILATYKGNFHNYWVDVPVWLPIHEWGFVLALASSVAAVGVWKLKRWSRWVETLLFALKLYGAYALFFWPYCITRSWIFLFLIGSVAVGACRVGLLWSPKVCRSFAVA